MFQELPVVERLAGMLATFLMELPHSECSETSDLLEEIAADSEILPIFRRALLKKFRHCSNDKRICEGEIFLAPLDEQLSERIQRRGAMHEFVLNLAGKRRESLCAHSIKEAEENLLSKGLTKKEIKERKVRFRSWLSGT